MPLWSVEEWRARIGSCWCALGRPFNTRFTRNRGKSRRVLTLRQLLTMVIMVMLLIVANLLFCAMHLKMSSALFDGGSYWKLHLLRYGLILYILLGILMTAVLMVSRLLSRQTRVSLRLFLIHVTHSFFLIGYLTLILTYPVWFIVNSLLNVTESVLKRISENLKKCGQEFQPGSMRLSLAIVVMVGAQLFISVSISRAVISLLLMTSGDVERNPGPTQSVIKASGTTSTCSANVLMFVLLQAMSLTGVQTALLMRSGDVETNPGPGRYGDLDYDAVDGNTVLSEDDFYEVYEKVVTISSRYFELGIALRLPPAELDSVRVDESKSARALSGVLQAWLKQNYNTEKHGPPTWQKLVEAVDSPAGGNNHALAKAIAAEHPIMVKGVAGTCNTMSKNTGDDSPILEGDEIVNTQDLVSDCTTSDANSTDSKQSKNDMLPEIDKEEELQQHTGNSSSSTETLPLNKDEDSQQRRNNPPEPKNNDKDEVLAEIEQQQTNNDTLPHTKKVQSEDMTDDVERGTESEDEQNNEEEGYHEEEFEQLLGEIKEYYGLWKPIGTELGVDVTAIERDYKGDSNRLQAVINQWPHSDKPSLKYKKLLKVCQSGGVFSAIRAFVEADDLLRDYYEVWKFIGTELDIDRNVMNTIEEDHSSDRDRLHALVEVWLNGAHLTGTRQRDLKEALQSQRVVSATAAVTINTENLEKVFELEKEHYRIWRAIGTELCVDVDTLSAIEKDHADDKDRLHAVIDSANPAPTREAMTKILQSANINIAIADLPLKAEDVERLIELKQRHYRVWKAIGMELGVDGDILSDIEKNHTDDSDRLHAVIDSANPAPTREAMTKILDSANISNAIAALPLSTKDVKRLIELKEKHYRVWKAIGTELGVDGDTLNAIERDHRNDSDRLHAVIDSANPVPTHEEMTKILQSANVNNAIAALLLRSEDFIRLFSVTKRYYRIWRIIGAELGMDGDLLKTIERGHLTDEDRLHTMIDSANPALTHERITKVLQSECISSAVKAVLNDEEVNEILNMARSYCRSWKSIGLELGIDSAALDAIKKNYVNDHRRLIAMIELWHSSVDLKPSREAMETVLQSDKITAAATEVNLQTSAVPLLTDGDYICDKNMTGDQDVFTYPYYWVNTHVCAVKLLQPVTPAQNYFEFKITSPGAICAVTIGVVGRDYPLDRHPGWVDEGIGYHADDGRLFNEAGYGPPFGPTCTAGDRMGCGIDFEGDEDSLADYVKVFFTKNGQQVGDFVNFKKPKSGLYPLMGMNSRGEQFHYLGRWNHLPKGEKGYEEELNQLLTSEGHVELDISKVIVTGAAGSGKTCTKLLLYKLPPPAQRQSTELIETMGRAYVKEITESDLEHSTKKCEIKHDIAYYEETSDSDEWIVLEAGSETLYGMLAATVDSKEYKYAEYKGKRDQPKQSPQEQMSRPAQTGQVLQSTKVDSKSVPIAQCQTGSKHPLTSMKETSTANPDPNPDTQKHSYVRQHSAARKSLLQQLMNPDQKGKCVHKVRWIHLVDSGGQSQFHDVLPAFLHHTSVIIFVLKLSESLDKQLFDDYFDEGQCIGDSQSREAPYRVEQILKGVIQSAVYEKHTEGNEHHSTKVLIVGTHKDQQTDVEDIEAKNSRLKEIFAPFVGSKCKQIDVLCRGDYKTGDILFPLDAMKRDKENEGMGSDIRKRVNKESKKVKVPISWFLLEEDMRSIGNKEENGIITIGKCKSLAEPVKLNEFQLEQALKYFHDLNIFLYFPYPSSLSRIVFTNPQIVVTIVSAFVKEAYQKVTDTAFKDFSERGEFTENFVKDKLSNFLVPDAGFKEAEVIELLKITLVVAHIEEGRYFMPCVLPHCSLDEFENERETLAVSSAVLKLPGDTHCVPRGFFCALVCGLMQKWKLRKKDGKLTDIYKNFVQFTVEDCRVTVADTFFYVEIHVHGDAPRNSCQKLFMDVGEALKVVVNTHNYDNKIVSSYSLDFLCPCGKVKDVHTTSTTITSTRCKLNCTMDDDSSFKLEKKHAVWLNDKEYSCWEKLEGAETLPALAALQSKVISSVETLSGFSDSMSDDEFIIYLKKEGLKEKDCSKMIDNCIGAQAFMEMTDADIDDKELGFTFGGRKILKRVLKTLSK